MTMILKFHILQQQWHLASVEEESSVNLHTLHLMFIKYHQMYQINIFLRWNVTIYEDNCIVRHLGIHQESKVVVLIICNISHIELLP